jgi:gliding motility-associated-like protein
MKKHLLLHILFLLITIIAQAQGPGCPNINAGPDQTLPCNTNCTTLNATLFQTGATNTYTVSAIGYAPPAPSSAWNNTFVNTDDVWSGVINLPFNFCYYGGVYDRLVVGANGVISFNTGYANQFCPWSFTAAVPSPALPLNAIFGAYHDIDPSVCGQIRYAISGSYPCRTFMFDFNQVCHFNCNTTRTTQRIVLYETSNVIEVYLGAKPICAGWNGGRAVVGIQNSGGDQGLVAPGRQTGSWNAANEAWRFTPSGAPNYQVNWYSSGVPGLIGTGTSINVCPTNTFTTYSAILTYTNCDNSTVTVNDYVNVTLTGQPQPPIFNNSPCVGQTLGLNTNPVAGATYLWYGPGGWTASGQSPTRPNATAAMSGTYTLYVVVAGCTSSAGTKNIAIIGGGTTPTFTVNTPICAGNTLTFNANAYTGATYVWSGPGGWTASVQSPTRTGATTAMSGVYSLYVVSGGCTTAVATQNVTVNAAPATPTISSNSPICTQTSINLFGPTVAGATYVWSGPGGWSSNLEDPTRPNANAAMSGTYSLYLVVAGCTSATANTTVTVDGPPIPTIDVPQRVCAGSNVSFLTGTYAGVGYQWSGPNGFTSTSATPSITGITAAGTGTYSLYLTLAGCTSLTVSSYMEVVTTPTPTISSNSPICVGATLNLSSNTIAGATYFWTGPNGFSSGSEDPSIVSATTAATGTYSLYVVADGCTSATATIPVTVNPTPTVAPVAPQTVCSGDPITSIAFSETVSGTTFSWTNSNPAIGLAASGNGNIPSFTATNPTTGNISGTITVTPTANGCPGPAQSFILTVKPRPTVSPISNISVCNAAANPQITIGSPVPGSTYAWTNNNTANGIPTSGNGNILSYTATNTGITPITTTITVTPTADGCPGAVSSFDIIIYPTPTANPIANQTYCNGASSILTTPVETVTGTTFNWTNNNTAIGLGANGNGSIPVFTATNTGNTTINGTISVTPTANACVGPVLNYNIDVYPTPNVNPIINQTICQGSASTLVTPASNVAGTTFTWTNSNPAIGLAAAGNGNIPAFTGLNTGSTPITSTIMVTPTANGCIGTPTSFTITVNPTATFANIPTQTYCPGTTTTIIAPTPTVMGTTYTWTSSNPAIGLSTSGVGDIPSFTATNPGSTAISSTVVFTPTANNCIGTPLSFLIEVSPTPTVSTIADQVVCNGQNTILVTPAGNIPTSTYAWTNNNASIGLAANGNGVIPAFTAINTGTTPVIATITVTPTANGCIGTPNSFTITVNPTPNVSNVANQAWCNGLSTPVTQLTGNIIGTTFTWTNDNAAIGLGISGNGDIPSYTATNTTDTPITASIIVIPSASSCLGIPFNFTIIVNPTPTVDPTGPQTLCNGSATTDIDFGGSVTGTSFAWTNDNPSVGLAATGNGDILPFTATNTGTTIQTAIVTVTPSANGCTGTPETFTITVNPTPTADTVGSQILCNGTPSATVTFTETVAGTSFGWTNDNPSIGLAATGNGNIASFNATNTGTAPVTATVTVTPSANGCTGAAETFTITVNPTPTVDTVGAQVLCNGTPTTAVTFAETVTGTSFGWTNDNTSIGLAASGNGDIPSFTATNTGTTIQTATVTVTPSANGCTGAAETFTITVNPTPTVDTVGAQVLCNGTPTTAVTFAETVTGTSFGWTNDNTSIGLATSGNGDIPSFTATNTGTTIQNATVTVTPLANGCTGAAETFTITVNPTPTVDTVGAQVLCNGAPTAAVTFVESVSGTTFAWTNDMPSIGLAGTGNGDIPSFTATNTGTTIQTATVTVTPSANGCTGAAETFTITVNPTPTVDTIGTQILCNGTPTTAVTFAETVTGTSFGWTNDNTSIGLAASGNGDIPSFTATNTGTTIQTATVTVTPSANGCTGAAETFTITVNPTPTVDTVGAQILCNGAPSTAVTFVESVSGTAFAWTNDNMSIGLAATGNGDIPSFTATNLGATIQTATVTVTPSANGCTGIPETFTITVNPTPTVITPINPQTLCNGAQTTAVTFLETVTGTSFDWTNSAPSIGLAAAGNGDISPFTATNTGGTAVTATITVTPSANGCTGTPETFTVTVKRTYIGVPVLHTMCNGNSYNFGGQNFTATGSYPIVFQAANGCDSTVTLVLTVNPTYNRAWPQTICNGASVSFGGNTYNTTGNYPITFQTINGCDSIVTLQLTVTPNPPVIINPQADQCFNGNSFDFSLAQTFAPGSTIDWTFTGANTPSSSVATPQNITYPTAGQYTVTVNVVENSCQSQGTININVLPQPEAQFNANPPIGCAPMKVAFTNLTNGGGDILWNFTGGTPATSTTSPVDVVYNTPGQYSVSLTVTFPNGCSDTEIATNLINAQASPTAGFSIQPEEVNMGDPTVTFINSSIGGSNIYYYVGDNGGVSGPTSPYTFTEEGTYDVMQIVTSFGGCSDTAYGQLVVIGNTEVFIPNAFTPNYDNLNTSFKVAGYGFSDFHMMIFDRWGELLFESHNQDQGWDGTYMGKPCKPDVYVYKIELKNFKNSLKSYLGSVTLVN